MIRLRVPDGLIHYRIQVPDNAVVVRWLISDPIIIEF